MKVEEVQKIIAAREEREKAVLEFGDKLANNILEEDLI